MVDKMKAIQQNRTCGEDSLLSSIENARRKGSDRLDSQRRAMLGQFPPRCQTFAFLGKVNAPVSPVVL